MCKQNIKYPESNPPSPPSAHEIRIEKLEKAVAKKIDIIDNWHAELHDINDCILDDPDGHISRNLSLPFQGDIADWWWEHNCIVTREDSYYSFTDQELDDLVDLIISNL